jgi:hypothetical protein
VLARVTYVFTQLARARVDKQGMSAFGHHVIMRLVSSQVLARTPEARRRAARILHEEGRRGLLAFRLADTHAHALLICTRREAGRFANYVEQRLRWHLQLPSSFVPANVVLIQSQGHLERAFWYVLRQEEHHGIALDPRHEASSAQDLLGLRVVAPDFLPRVQSALPRLRIGELADGLALERCEPALDHLANAAAAAFALPCLDRSAHAAAARAAAVHAAAELSAGEIAERLAVSRRCVERLRHQPVPTVLVRAVRTQLTVRPRRGDSWLGTAPAPALLRTDWVE